MIQSYNANFRDASVIGTFLDNHDNPPLLSFQPDMALYKSGLVFTIMSSGIPIVYYGTEQGFSGGADPKNREPLWTTGCTTSGPLYHFLKQVVGWRKQFQVWAQPQVERYADDIIVHCKTERQAHFMLAQIIDRMSACGLTVHPEKTSIVNLRGKSEHRYPRKYYFLRFTIRPVMREIKGRWLLMPGTFVSTASKTAIRKKFSEMEIHKRRKPIEELARE